MYQGFVCILEGTGVIRRGFEKHGSVFMISWDREGVVGVCFPPEREVVRWSFPVDFFLAALNPYRER